MDSKLKNTILSVRRCQRHLKLAFIVADEEISEAISGILNWCSYNVRGSGSLIYTLNSLKNRLNQSLCKEHSPDFLVKIGNIPQSVIEELEHKYQPFGKTSDYITSIENADLTKMVKLVKLVGMLLQTKVYLFWAAQPY